MVSNHIPPTSMPLPSHISQRQPNPGTSPFMLDGGVYQGQPPPPTTQPNDWNPNTKVK
jgi:hypothetical protein